MYGGLSPWCGHQGLKSRPDDSWHMPSPSLITHLPVWQLLYKRNLKMQCQKYLVSQALFLLSFKRSIHPSSAWRLKVTCRKFKDDFFHPSLRFGLGKESDFWKMSLSFFIFLKQACWLQIYVFQSIFTLFSSGTTVYYYTWSKAKITQK